MNEKPEALRLADKLSSYKLSSGYASYCHKAATELRRQHAEIERLREEVKKWQKSFGGHLYIKTEDYAELIGKRDALKTENERLRGLLTEAREDVERLGPGLLLDRIDAALRREEKK